MQGEAQIVLASASPRRGELLDQIGISYKVHAVDIDEAVKPDESPRNLAQRLALEKARCGRADMLKQNVLLPVLGADTVVEIDGDVLGKPADSQQAIQMLTRLSGTEHQVHTAVTVITKNNEYTDVCSSRVGFDELDSQTIEAYVATGEPMDKAGAYAIQGMAAQFITLLSGSYSGVVGLPLYETAKLLKVCGVTSLHNNK